jgi:ABC-2 type transport system ATP-binding protein
MIQIDHLSFGYSKKRLLYKDISLTMEKGRIYGLLGKNGAGKSTFLKNLGGLVFPSSGRISVFGEEPRKRQPAFLQDIYMITEEVYVPSISSTKYARLYSPFYPKFNDQQFRQYLEKLEVEPAASLKSLSFGQQKKFIIAFALACNTSLLLLDEPTNGLDIPSKAQFRRLIASVLTEERTIIISTHQTRDLENLIDNVLILDNGKILLHESIDQIIHKMSFKILKTVPDDREVFYSEKTLGGYAVVSVNNSQEEDQMNLEQLFNAVIEKPLAIKHLFPSKSSAL